MQTNAPTRGQARALEGDEQHGRQSHAHMRAQRCHSRELIYACLMKALMLPRASKHEKDSWHRRFNERDQIVIESTSKFIESLSSYPSIAWLMWLRLCKQQAKAQGRDNVSEPPQAGSHLVKLQIYYTTVYLLLRSSAVANYTTGVRWLGQPASKSPLLCCSNLHKRQNYGLYRS